MRTPALLAFTILLGCSEPSVATPPPRALPSPSTLEAHCRDIVGEPRVEEVADGVWVAIGYDLANTILVQTSAGNVVIDAGMSPARSQVSRDALLAKAPGKTAAIVFTHSHIDHVGGATAWFEDGTEVWATDRFQEHFFKQYGVFLPAENARGARQFGRDVPVGQLPCSGLGRRVDIKAALDVGVVLPTHTFSGTHELTVGDVTLSLVEAHGETDDQLFVWHEAAGVLIPGDNWYRAFPNLYTIRGARPRPVGSWISSLDAMRRKEARVLLPSHTIPVTGKDAVAAALTSYRDGIQWVRDETIRRANRGQSVDVIAAELALPPHLADVPALAELYGQIDWSARAIYGNELGWFDGKAQRLYPLAPNERADRLVAHIGGAEAVRAAATTAQQQGEHAWALELLTMLGDAQPGTAEAPDAAHALDDAIADSLEALASGTTNTNGRGYLLQAAGERRAHGVTGSEAPSLSDDFVASIPISMIFRTMASRLRAHEVMDRHDAVVFDFTDTNERWTLTIRRGIAEVVPGDPLPGTPEPIATLRTDTTTWRRLAMRVDKPMKALKDGRLEIDGSELGLKGFLDRFDRGLGLPDDQLELP